VKRRGHACGFGDFLDMMQEYATVRLINESLLAICLERCIIQLSYRPICALDRLQDRFDGQQMKKRRLSLE
jgi:hypothetical protein